MPTALAKRSDRIELDVSDCLLTRNSLAISSEAGFMQAGLALACMDSCSQWWWGDYLLYAEKHNLKTVLDSARGDLHRSTINSYVECARLYSPEDRHPDLSFSHHSAIMYILGVDGTVQQAKKWLKIAAVIGEDGRQMTVGELREKMRAHGRKDEQDPGPMRGVVRITDIIKLERWTETVCVKDLPDTEAQEIRKSTGSLFAFLCELHRKPFSGP